MPVVAGLLAASATFAVLEATGDDRAAGRRSPAAVDSAPGGATGGGRSVSEDTPAGTVEAGRAVFARMGCGNCHAFRAGNSEGGFGAPDLDAVLPRHTRASLKAQILDPYPGMRDDFFPIMPTDYGRRMSGAELDALVTFLLAGR